jgi:hypothetical protein
MYRRFLCGSWCQFLKRMNTTDSLLMLSRHNDFQCQDAAVLQEDSSRAFKANTDIKVLFDKIHR